MALIKRQLQQVIEERIFQGKAIILIGARQVGKSTLFQQILSELHTKGITNEQVLMMDCDDPEIRGLLQNANLNDLGQMLVGKRVALVDEAQRVKGIGLTLKMITDHFPDVQLLVTGSSSFLLQGQLNEPLTGRKFEYRLFPISTQELYNDGGLVLVKQSLESRLVFGSYPDVLSQKENARELLGNLSGSYLYQDLLSLEGVRKPAILEKLLVALALQLGDEVSYNELAQTVGTDSKTVEKYIDLLEKCYVIFHLSALSRNLRTELKKSKKFYFYDNGIRNALIRNYNPIALRNDTGALWENWMISELVKKRAYDRQFVNRYFWRTTQQQEIDYIEEADGHFTAYEFKWNPKKKAKISQTFLKAYPNTEIMTVNPENFYTLLL